MLGNNALELKGFFANKSILQNFRFSVTFIDNPFNFELVKRIGPFPITESWHVLGVTIPQYDFKKEVQHYGPILRSYPILEYDGMEFKIDFEEDKYGTVGKFITYLQRRVVDTNGVYTPPGKVKISRIIVTTENENGAPVGIFTFHQCYYLQCSDVDYRYNENDSVKYSVVFNADFMTAHFPIALGGLVNKAKGIVDKIGNIKKDFF